MLHCSCSSSAKKIRLSLIANVQTDCLDFTDLLLLPYIIYIDSLYVPPLLIRLFSSSRKKITTIIKEEVPLSGVLLAAQLLYVSALAYLPSCLYLCTT